MKFNVVLSKTAEKNLSKLPTEVVINLNSLLQNLEDNPRSQGCIKLKGYL